MGKRNRSVALAESLAQIKGLPPHWRAMLRQSQIVPVSAGMSGAFVARISGGAGETRYLKMACGRRADELANEIIRTEWLAARGVRVPAILMKFRNRKTAAILMTAVAGSQLSPGMTSSIEVADAIGRGLARLHALPIADCPFDETAIVRLRRARGAVDQNFVDASQFDDGNAGLTPEELYRRVAAAMPKSEDNVVVHGDATLSNILIDAGGEIGFVDCGHSGVSDAYVDLALIERELRDDFGAAADSFLAGYGIREWDRHKAEFFIDLYEFF